MFLISPRILSLVLIIYVKNQDLFRKNDKLIIKTKSINEKTFKKQILFKKNTKYYITIDIYIEKK